MRLTDNLTINFNNNMSTTAAFLDIEKTFDTTWHPGLLYKLYKLTFSTNLIKIISSFLYEEKFTFIVEVEISTHREIQSGVPQVSVLSPTLYRMCIIDTPKHQVFIWPFLPMTLVCMPQIAKRVMFSESSTRSQFN
jgi:hypothetical protein